MKNKPIHILRYGTVAEKVHLEKSLSAYDYLSINGNSAAYVSSAIAKFIVEKFFTKPEKGFFIDPITYAFQSEIKLLQSKSKVTGDITIKKSVKKLIERYGFPANKVETGVPISVDDFNDESVKEHFCNNILDFQYNLVYDHIKDNDLQKYLDYAVPFGANQLQQFRPKFLIAPYFYLNSNDNSFKKWLELNVSFAKIAIRKTKEQYDSKELFIQIVVDKNLLHDSDLIDEIINAYNNIECDGFTIWVDDLNEHEATEQELTGFIKLLNGLKHKPIFNMYGGYFSVLLTHQDLKLLSGVSHGLEYGESRKVYPVGGGIPVSKYYFLPLHQRMDFTKAFYLLEHNDILDTYKENWGSTDKYYSNICKCIKCKEILQKEMINFVEFESREFYEIHRKEQVLRRKKASADTKQNCLYHYLLCKKMEFYRVEKTKLDVLINDLMEQKSIYETCDTLHEKELEYIDLWTNVLKRV